MYMGPQIYELLNNSELSNSTKENLSALEGVRRTISLNGSIDLAAINQYLGGAEAFAIMMHVHQSGVGVAGRFTRDVAETKVKATQQLAEQNEYPLLVTTEPDAESRA